MALTFLEEKILNNQNSVEAWFKQQWKLTPPPIYGSVDLRNAGFKLAPVDMNLFPAGFNNLSSELISFAINKAKETFSSDFKKILIIPENHTRNVFYWESVKILKMLLTKAGYEIRIGLLKEIELKALDDGAPLGLLSRSENRLRLNDFIPDAILLNNDLSEGTPDLLKDIVQPIFPPAELGWHIRLKSNHFHHYQLVSAEFSHLIEIDSWLISSLFQQCGEINFLELQEEDCLIHDAEKLFNEIEKKYKEYDIERPPFIIIKADAGTYGMAVMTIRNINELRNLNRKERTRMSKTKGGKPVHKIILQEGVYTVETWGPTHSAAEPVVYLWKENVLGGFYRVHKDRMMDENLNSPGMHFESFICKETLCQKDEYQAKLYLYGVIARLSMLAAAREIKEIKGK